MSIYERGAIYGERIVTLPFMKVIVATKRNISGTYTKYVWLPGFFFGRNYRTVTMKICGVTIYQRVMPQNPWKP